MTQCGAVWTVSCRHTQQHLALCLVTANMATLKGRNKQRPMVLDEPQKLWCDDEDGQAASHTQYPKYDPYSSEIKPRVSIDQK